MNQYNFDEIYENILISLIPHLFKIKKNILNIFIIYFISSLSHSNVLLEEDLLFMYLNLLIMNHSDQ